MQLTILLFTHSLITCNCIYPCKPGYSNPNHYKSRHICILVPWGEGGGINRHWTHNDALMPEVEVKNKFQLFFAVSPSTPSTRPSWTLWKMPRHTPSTAVTATSTSGKQTPTTTTTTTSHTHLPRPSINTPLSWRRGRCKDLRRDAKTKNSFNFYNKKTLVLSSSVP